MNKTGPKPKPFECPENLFWYLVGLVATDGCLINNGRRVTITAKDRRYLMQLRKMLGLKTKIARKRGGFGDTIGHDLNIGRKIFYNRLLEIGLTPRKSLTLGSLRVPPEEFQDFLRGVIDGDGSIRSWMHPTNGREQWSLRIVSASKPFVRWISDTIGFLWNVTGKIHKEPARSERHHPKYILKYGKLAAKVILGECYSPGGFALERKRKIAIRCISGSVGWSRSKTVVNRSSWKSWTYLHAYGAESKTYTIREPHATSLGQKTEFVFQCDGRGVGMADDEGLKPSARKGVRVRVPPPAYTGSTEVKRTFYGVDIGHTLRAILPPSRS